MYAKDCRKKVVSSVMHKAKTKSLSANGIYGYKNENGILVVDEAVRPVIIRIFNEYSTDKNPTAIAKGLKADEIPTPAYYREYISKKNFKLKNNTDPYDWNGIRVSNIVKSHEYYEP